MTAIDYTRREQHESYITLDTYTAKKGEAGGFGFGGSNGSSGGFGIGGEGPQPGLGLHRQAHYENRLGHSAAQANAVCFKECSYQRSIW